MASSRQGCGYFYWLACSNATFMGRAAFQVVLQCRAHVCASTAVQPSSSNRADSFQPGIATPQAALNPAPDTIWHSAYDTADGSLDDPLPHQITIRLGGGTYTITGLRYRPRQDGLANGNCGDFEVRCCKDVSAVQLDQDCAHARCGRPVSLKHSCDNVHALECVIARCDKTSSAALVLWCRGAGAVATEINIIN